jgi:cyclic lactone autoinducer peptide
MKNLAGKLLAKIALASAKTAAGTSSSWNLYQPKEPKNIKKAK